MSKILKNQTGSPINITDVGVTLQAYPNTYTINPQDYLMWAASSDIISEINNDNVLVSDGVIDLNKSRSVGYMKSTNNIFYDSDTDEILGRFGSTLKVMGVTPIYNLSNTTTSTTSSTYSTIDSMSISLNPGTYICFFGCSAGINEGDGDIVMYLDDTELVETSRKVYINTSGLVGASANIRVSIKSMEIMNITTTSTLTMKFRENGNSTLYIYNRVLVTFPVSRNLWY